MQSTSNPNVMLSASMFNPNDDHMDLFNGSNESLNQLGHGLFANTPSLNQEQSLGGNMQQEQFNDQYLTNNRMSFGQNQMPGFGGGAGYPPSSHGRSDNMHANGTNGQLGGFNGQYQPNGSNRQLGSLNGQTPPGGNGRNSLAAPQGGANGSGQIDKMMYDLELEKLNVEREKMELERSKMNHELELERLRAGGSQHRASGLDPKLKFKVPTLTDSTDIETYLAAFENIASTHGFDESQWVAILVPYLSGKALEAYTKLPLALAKDYAALKKAILVRYCLNAETYRHKFRTTKRKDGESFTEFTVALEHSFSHWVSMEEVDSFQGLIQLCVKEQAISSCPAEMRNWLKEKSPKTLSDLNELGDQYVAIYGYKLKQQSQQQSAGKSSVSGNVPPTTKPPPKPGGESGPSPRPFDKDKASLNKNIRCFSCNKLGHKSPDCPDPKKPRGSAHLAKSVFKANLYETGVVNGVSVKALRDTGCSTTLVHGDLVPVSALLDEYVCLTLADGSQCTFPMATVQVELDDIKGSFKVGVVNTLPEQVLLGNDLGDSAYLVQTRSRTRAHENGVQEQYTAKTPVTDVKRSSGLPAGDPPVVSNGSNLLPAGDADEVQEFASGSGVLPAGDADEVQEFASGSAVLPAGDADEVKEFASGSAVLPAGDSGVVEELSVASVLPAGEPPVTDPYKVGCAELQELQTLDPGCESLAKFVVPLEEVGRVGFYYKDNILFRRWTAITGRNTVEQMVLPAALKSEVLRLAHDTPVGGHMGVKKTRERVLKHFYWPNIFKEVAEYVLSCDICQKVDTKPSKVKAKLIPMPVITVPFERIGVDIIGELPRSRRGNRFGLVIMDYGSRYPECIPMRTVTAERVAEELFKVFCRVGFPKEILTDQGTNFMSKVFQQFCKMLGVKKLKTTVYHPQCNGLVERYNGTLKKSIKKFVHDHPARWDDFIPALLFAYREVPCDSTGFSPFELLYGRTVCGPLALMKEQWLEEPTTDPENLVKFVVDVRTQLAEAASTVKRNVTRAQLKQKQYFDRSAKDRSLEVGDSVLVLLPSSTSKLEAQWQGPFLVSRKLSHVDFEVEISDQAKKVYHINLLRKYKIREVEASFAEADLESPNLKQTESVEDVQLGDGLNSAQREELESLLNSYSHVFTDLPGSTNLVTHSVNTGSAKPIFCRPYRIPEAMKKAVATEIKRLLDLGLIQSSTSPWASNPVFVRKRDGQWRFCLDYRLLNAETVFDPFPIPRMDEFLESAGLAIYLSLIDLTKGYWQIALDRDAQLKSSFITSDGQYEFLVMPFGMKNAPATFVRMMTKLTEGLEFANAYFDDLVVFSSSWEDHMAHLRVILQRLEDAGLTARPVKCRLGFDEVELVGHKVGHGVIKPLKEKGEAVLNFPIPKSKSNVRQFLGLAGFYSKFIPKYSDLVHPLVELTKKSKPNQVCWTSEADAAFNKLKSILVSDLVLAVPDFSDSAAPFVLQCDASNVGLGAVLAQGDRPVQYLSRKLTPAEANYSTIEKECLCIVWAIDKCKRFLFLRDFVIQSDHKPLQWLHRMKDKNQRLLRWSLALQEVSYKAEYKKGILNSNADALSRAF